jgi:hypothetical protein
MTIDEIKDKKARAESEINNILLRFEEQTGLEVSLLVVHDDIHVMGKNFPKRVELEVKIK